MFCNKSGVSNHCLYRTTIRSGVYENKEDRRQASLRRGVERFLITDINNPAASAMAESGVFVMYDNMGMAATQFNHIPGGSNVLYMDGHAEFVKYPGTPPVNKRMTGIMRMFDFRHGH